MISKFLWEIFYAYLYLLFAQRYLEMTMDPSSVVRKQNAGTVVNAVASNIVGHYVAWNWLRNEWPRIVEYFDTTLT